MDGYATYLPSSSKNVAELKGINYKKLSGEGLFSRLENSTYLGNARQYFIQKGNEYYSSRLLDIPDILLRIQKEIEGIQVTIQSATLKWQAYLKSREMFTNFYCCENSEQEKYYTDGSLTEAPFESDITDLSSLEQKVISYFRNESFSEGVLLYRY